MTSVFAVLHVEQNREGGYGVHENMKMKLVY